MQSLLLTIQNRPYVVAFLMAFLVIGLLNRGPLRTLLFLIIGYTIAFLSEFCSIRWGFPYGMYHYIYENMKGELMLGGVPVWDSISYVFMAYASYEMANWIKKWRVLPRAQAQSCSPVARDWAPPPGSPAIFLSSLLMTLLDIMTDPLAVRGDQWFLGKIFYYPNGGIYFGVPLSNFAGWFLVGLVIFSLYEYAGKIAGATGRSPLRIPFLGPLFYLSIMAFNVVITFAIGEWGLGFIGLMIIGFIGLFSFRRCRT
ncbi:MAG: carotenoid biosynthesis protein [Deltaproteobacteria bacterium]|nr:carotenoid biosynthesis protein [Deltaproteobacteria bacterium]